MILIVIDDVELTFMGYGRGRRTPVHGGLVRGHLLLPELLAVVVIAGQADVPEIGVDAIFIDNGRFRGVCVLDMRRARVALERLALPEHLARVAVQTRDEPAELS